MRASYGAGSTRPASVSTRVALDGVAALGAPSRPGFPPIGFRRDVVSTRGEERPMSRASDGTCAVIGAGLGGAALAASMALCGYRVRLHDLNDARLTDIRDLGGVEVAGLFQGFAKIELATPHLAPAVDGADIIAVCTG